MHSSRPGLGGFQSCTEPDRNFVWTPRRYGWILKAARRSHLGQVGGSRKTAPRRMALQPGDRRALRAGAQHEQELAAAGFDIGRGAQVGGEPRDAAAEPRGCLLRIAAGGAAGHDLAATLAL